MKACVLHSAPGQTATVKNVGKETVSAPLALTQAHLDELHQFFFVSHGHSLKVPTMYITNTCKHHKYNTDRIEVLFCFPFFTYQGHAGMGSFAQFLLLGVSEPFLHCSHLHLSAALSYTSKLVLIEQMNIKTTNGKLSYSQFVISEIFSSPGSNGCSEPCTLKCCSGHLDARSPIAE